MSDDVIGPGSGVIYMKVGTHADEPLEAIIERKRREIDNAGFALWGYGGNTCHPTTMVQPFARGYEVRGQTVHLVMHPMISNHFAVSARADEMSVDGQKWTTIPDPINVIGSRYALAIADLEPVEFTLPLAQTRVAEGNSKGRRGDEYIQGRVDKAVLDVVADSPTDAAPELGAEEIGLMARLVDPYAVFVRIQEEEL
jgi:hypothetical protein